MPTQEDILNIGQVAIQSSQVEAKLVTLPLSHIQLLA
jgi:hypothetical protein